MLNYLKSIFSLEAYYSSMQQAFMHLFNQQQMLHYPMYKKSGQTLLEGQEYFTTYCLDKLGSVENKIITDIGCGNGIQTTFIFNKYGPKQITGVDMNSQNIEVASALISGNEDKRINFLKDNAEKLELISDNSTDVVICIESAFHYGDKNAFLQQVRRILKPDGIFLIADLILKPQKQVNPWEKKVKFNNWNKEQYEAAFLKEGLKLNYQEELTPKIIMAFQDSKNWFKNKHRSRKISYLFSLVFAKTILKLYTHQLNTRHSYVLFIGNQIT
jgi:ubiquinone/menaquinone biosynthesis C-methylase UbiE